MRLNCVNDASNFSLSLFTFKIVINSRKKKKSSHAVERSRFRERAAAQRERIHQKGRENNENFRLSPIPLVLLSLARLFARSLSCSRGCRKVAKRKKKTSERSHSGSNLSVYV
jgi:hypothetical protein